MKKIILAISLLGILALSAKAANSEDSISLSITPPLVETLIIPGNSIEQHFTVSNNGSSVVLTPRVVYFDPSDNLGNVGLSKDPSPQWVEYQNSNFRLGPKEEKDIKVVFSPPIGTSEGDYYLSLTLETAEPDNLSVSSSIVHKAVIAANILITINTSGNPEKSAAIVKFEAPKIIDWFSDIPYDVEIKNTGEAFAKPNGEITVSSLLGKQTKLVLAPQNILAGTSRRIYCLKNNSIIDCLKSGRPHLGLYKADLSFSLDKGSSRYTGSQSTLALPISGFIIIALISLLLYVIRSLSKK